MESYLSTTVLNKPELCLIAEPGFRTVTTRPGLSYSKLSSYTPAF